MRSHNRVFLEGLTKTEHITDAPHHRHTTSQTHHIPDTHTHTPLTHTKTPRSTTTQKHHVINRKTPHRHTITDTLQHRPQQRHTTSQHTSHTFRGVRFAGFVWTSLRRLCSPQPSDCCLRLHRHRLHPPPSMPCWSRRKMGQLSR